MEPENDDPNSSKKIGGAYAKYTGIGLQMIIFVLVGVFAGIKLDAWLKLTFPAFTLGAHYGFIRPFDVFCN